MVPILIESITIGIVNSVERVAWYKGSILMALFSCSFEKFIKQRRSDNNRGAAIKGKDNNMVGVSQSDCLVSVVVENKFMPLRKEKGGERKATKTRTDNNNILFLTHDSHMLRKWQGTYHADHKEVPKPYIPVTQNPY